MCRLQVEERASGENDNIDKGETARKVRGFIKDTSDRLVKGLNDANPEVVQWEEGEINDAEHIAMELNNMRLVTSTI